MCLAEGLSLENKGLELLAIDDSIFRENASQQQFAQKRLVSPEHLCRVADGRSLISPSQDLRWHVIREGLTSQCSLPSAPKQQIGRDLQADLDQRL